MEISGFSPSLSVGVDARLHAVEVEQVKAVLERLPHAGEAVALQVLELVHEGGVVLLPAGLDVAGGLLEREQHVAVAHAVLAALPELEERLDGPLGHVQVRLLHAVHVHLLAHGRGRVDEEQDDGHPGRRLLF